MCYKYVALVAHAHSDFELNAKFSLVSFISFIYLSDIGRPKLPRLSSCRFLPRLIYRGLPTSFLEWWHGAHSLLHYLTTRAAAALVRLRAFLV